MSWDLEALGSAGPHAMSLPPEQTGILMTLSLCPLYQKACPDTSAYFALINEG